MELIRSATKELTVFVSQSVKLRIDLGFDFATVLKAEHGVWKEKAEIRTVNFSLNDLDKLIATCEKLAMEVKKTGAMELPESDYDRNMKLLKKTA